MYLIVLEKVKHLFLRYDSYIYEKLYEFDHYMRLVLYVMSHEIVASK